MRLRWAILCLIVGHNKMVYVNEAKGYSQYFTVCSQCKRKWLNEQLSDKPNTFKSHSIKIRAHVNIIITNTPRSINEKQAVNFYLL